MKRILRDELVVPDEMMEVFEERHLIAPRILEEIGIELEEECYILEVYPTWDGLEVERIPF